MLFKCYCYIIDKRGNAMNDTKKIFETYCDFVTKVTSDPSIDLDSLKNSFDDIESSSPIKTPRLLTAALGLGSETGEFVEIVKKMLNQKMQNFTNMHYLIN